MALNKQQKYELALKKHIKWMRSLGLNVDDTGNFNCLVSNSGEINNLQINNGLS